MKDIVRKIGMVAVTVLLAGTSCKENGVASDRKTDKNDRPFGYEGGVTLLIKDADLIQVDSNPQHNTAEWQFKVNKPGRYDVWLSSLTCDTSHLLFAENVTITAGDARLEKKPVGDEIVIDDKSVKSPWYRADSHMGSVFFSKPGEYQVQVISDRVMRLPSDPAALTVDKHTLINSLILKPMVN
jgi:hypothetical protein